MKNGLYFSYPFPTFQRSTFYCKVQLLSQVTWKTINFCYCLEQYLWYRVSFPLSWIHFRIFYSTTNYRYEKSALQDAFACITRNNRVARELTYLYMRITFTRYIFITSRAPVHRAVLISAKAISQWASIEIFPGNRWKGRSRKVRVAHNDNGDYNAVGFSFWERRCLRNMIKRSRLSWTRGCRGVSRSSYRAG